MPPPTALPQFLEVELGSYCNRRCAWCPNAWHERGQRKDSMELTVWRALLADLSAAGYAGWFAFHNYNEPMADPSLFDRLGEARRALPNARLELHTNGDYLDPASLEQLRAVGLAVLRVTLYPSNERAFAPPDPARLERYLARLGLGGRGRSRSKASKLEHQVRVGKLLLEVRLPRIERYTDRAGSVGLNELRATQPRTWPCTLPTRSAAIDFHGNLKLCCHVYDATDPASAPYLLGNVAQAPFTSLWRSERLEALRAQLGRADFQGLPACARCPHREGAGGG